MSEVLLKFIKLNLTVRFYLFIYITRLCVQKITWENSRPSLKPDVGINAKGKIQGGKKRTKNVA